MIELSAEGALSTTLGASIKVVGIGGAGGNAVNSMIEAGDTGAVSFIVANTDAQSLNLSPAEYKIQLGHKVTKGLGAGSNPEVGRRAAEEDLESVISAISDADILFLTAGLGGGTGSGALPVIAAAAKELGILTVAIVTKPFMFEGKRRLVYAEHAVKQLRSVVDTFIVVPNQKLLEVADPKISMIDAFGLSNNVLRQAIKGISDIITRPGLINVDFADVRTVMKDMGLAIMGTSRCKGEDRAKKAAMAAINSPLLENVNIHGARGVLINITGNSDLGLHEINDAANVVYEMVSEDANIILGSVIDPAMHDEVMVTVIATGFEAVPLQATPAATVEKPAEAVQTQQVAQTVVPRISNETVALRAAQYKIEPEIAPTLTPAAAPVRTATLDLHDLDTPAFLRKKAENEQQS